MCLVGDPVMATGRLPDGSAVCPEALGQAQCLVVVGLCILGCWVPMAGLGALSQGASHSGHAGSVAIPLTPVQPSAMFVFCPNNTFCFHSYHLNKVYIL